MKRHLKAGAFDRLDRFDRLDGASISTTEFRNFRYLEGLWGWPEILLVVV